MLKLRSIDFRILHILISEGKVMPDKKTKKEKNSSLVDGEYAHNPRYCMILPDAADADEEDIISTGQS